MRWILLDEVLEIKRGKSARSRGRIPDTPVSPEPLLIEMMAQTGGLVLGAEFDFSRDVIFAKIQNAEFFPGWAKGTSVEIEACAETLRPEGAWFDAQVRACGGLVGKSRFLLMCLGHIDLSRKRSVTFHENFMNYYGILEKVQGGGTA